MKNYLFLILLCFLLLCSISVISAENNDDTIITDSLNHDVNSINIETRSMKSDNSIIQSNENNSKDSKTTNNENPNLSKNNDKINGNSYKKTISNKKSTISSKCKSTSVNKKSSTYTFKDLYKLINSGKKSLKLTKNCIYNPKTDSDFKTGVRITKNIIIDGCGHYISGQGLVKCIRICPKLKVTIKNLNIYNGCATSDGAGIFLGEKSSLILKNCKLRNHKVYNANGAAVYCYKGSSFKAVNCFFKNNTSIRVSKKPWEKFKSGMGSVLKSAIGAKVFFSHCNFTKNKAYMSTILVVSYSEGSRKTSNLHINRCIFANNTSTKCGVIYSDELGKAFITNSVFKENYSKKHSGVISLDSSLYALVQNCLFQSNQGYNGGAITVRVFDPKYKSHVKILKCKFIDNLAKTDGGAICSVYGIVMVKNCYFSKNHAKRYGGAIYARDTKISTYFSELLENKAKSGGACYLLSKKPYFSRCAFYKNSAGKKTKNVYSKYKVKYYKCKF